MKLHSAKHAARAAFITSIVVSVMLLSPASRVQAAGDGELEPDGIGIAGGALVGAELGFIVPAVAGVDATWAYIVFPIIGAVGGGTAGYFLIEQSWGSAEVAAGTLAFGIAMIIPTMVLTLSETAYDPTNMGKGWTVASRQSQGSVTAKSNASARREVRCTSRLCARGRTGLLQLHAAEAKVGVPAVEISAGKFAQLGQQDPNVPAEKGLRVSLLSGTF